ncbi:MAG TPA: N-6 DNA methylase [Gemmatimonadaceae bacterium]
MQTLRAAAALLSAAISIDALAPLARLVGCDEPQPLDSRTREAIGVDRHVVEARVARGCGATRALLVVVAANAALLDVLPRIAAQLSLRTPHILWIVIAAQPQSHLVAVAAWTDDRRPPRIAALLANRASLVDSDAETIRALGAATTDSDIVSHRRWVEILGREALTVRFYRALERAVDSIAESSRAGTREVRRELALLNTSRLLFLSFLEAKGWLDGDASFLARRFDQCMTSGGRFHDRVLRALFFGTLNTPIENRARTAQRFGAIPFLNGGLFTRTSLERRHHTVSFSDEAYGGLIADLFGQYRFTAREETASWSEAAVDPEMLGRAFESLMVSAERRRTGAFFTPFSLVQRVADAGLDEALAGGSVDTLKGITVLDPACGSGAFLVYALERIADALLAGENARELSAVRRDVLTRSIFGVDVNPTAVWLCELRLWLSVVIDSAESDPTSVAALPNLDRNIRAGDALSGGAFGETDPRLRGAGLFRRLRQRYTRASGPRKESLARELDRAERGHALTSIDAGLTAAHAARRELLTARRGRDLFGDRYQPSRAEWAAAIELRKRTAALRVLRRKIVAGGALPFSFPVHFADVASRGGFDLILGNPPWVRLHHVPPHQRAEFRREFDVARNAAWMDGAGSAGAGRGFAAQVDVAALFVERSVRLLAPQGTLALVLPVKLWQSLAGGGVRRLLAREMEVRRVDDCSAAPSLFDAAVYPSVIVARRPRAAESSCRAPISVSVHDAQRTSLAWQVPVDSLGFDQSAGAPWVLLPPDARRAFDRVREAGPPLAQSRFGRPLLGVKCGCNEAFVVKVIDDTGNIAEVLTSDGRRASIERAMLRPLLRGECLHRWRAAETADRIIWTHGDDDMPCNALPPYAARWFARWRRELQARTDAKHNRRWWGVFRTESARSARPRVVWGDMGREPRASVLCAGDVSVALNSCYVARCVDLADAHAFAALLNGPLARAWLNAIAEPARGGYRRYLGWTVSLLPIPHDWNRAVAVLAPLGERGLRGDAPSEGDLLDASLEAYGIQREIVAPLVAWQSR